jgi:hypothetical protein
MPNFIKRKHPKKRREKETRGQGPKSSQASSLKEVRTISLLKTQDFKKNVHHWVNLFPHFIPTKASVAFHRTTQPYLGSSTLIKLFSQMLNCFYFIIYCQKHFFLKESDRKFEECIFC